jgi:hypothetical protein
MSLAWVLIIVLLVIVVGGAPGWGYHSLGYYPSGAIGLLLLVLLVLVLMGRL